MVNCLNKDNIVAMARILKKYHLYKYNNRKWCLIKNNMSFYDIVFVQNNSTSSNIISFRLNRLKIFLRNNLYLSSDLAFIITCDFPIPPGPQILSAHIGSPIGAPSVRYQLAAGRGGGLGLNVKARTR